MNIHNSSRAAIKHWPAIIILSLLVVFLFIVSMHAIRRSVDDRLQSHDIAQTTREMADARSTLTPLLNPLGIELSPPAAASCAPGDPSLYKHSCGLQVTASFRDHQAAPQDADQISQKLKTLDVGLKRAGWKYGGNDFRSQPKQPAGTWANVLRTYGADIAYQKGTCNFEITIPATVTQPQNVQTYPGHLSCYIDDGPATLE